MIPAAPVAGDHASTSSPYLIGLEMRFLVGVDRRNRHLATRRPLTRPMTSICRSNWKVSPSLVRYRDQRPAVVRHIAAEVLRHGSPKAPLASRKALVGEKLVDRHAAPERPGVHHPGPLHDVGLFAVERLEDVKHPFGGVLAVRVEEDRGLGPA